MRYFVKTTPEFDSRLKSLLKKYPSLSVEFRELVLSLAENPRNGISLGKGCYKKRLSIASKGKGKSGGARVIYYVHVSETTIYLLTIFDKSERESLSPIELKELLSTVDRS
ncbi:type II toxin-antitoxin system RelE/ParE family toxin [Dyadobacter jiangsuensis]|uniref:mRNA-degrading endonuclease RelE of RelBE toxin-antitoxin system n=1 Tax=Dyadobacter jiangsuensis TaxID=1591085 RepID=A0A2P8G6H6_9BACT|nr:type II toxin-antitoxin system RelE/ParE family toxin [Dyadobacter jiangsuensis]PSL29556.1 mRNA-degrading endonuclease RelE of RelBE toxin-antitoxin system [Dyadobacter jiangsuensis]